MHEKSVSRKKHIKKMQQKQKMNEKSVSRKKHEKLRQTMIKNSVN